MAKIALYVKILFYIVNMGAVLKTKGVTCIQHTHNYMILVIGTLVLEKKVTAYIVT